MLGTVPQLAVAAAAAAAGAGAATVLTDTSTLPDDAALALHRANEGRATVLSVVVDGVAAVTASVLWRSTRDARWAVGAAALGLAVVLAGAVRASAWHAKLRTAAKGSSTTYLALQREARWTAARTALAATAAAVFCAAASA